MGRIVRYQFLGSDLLFWFLCMTGVGIPIAALYLLHSTVAIEEELSNPTEFVEQFRAGKFRKP
ncbi:MAG: hypothetical protein IT364_01320 [Candidatus Hydrogenedentes bacterium]|nr:hypothetical protein [Candidatus Hydrogenedentota bacterium]